MKRPDLALEARQSPRSGERAGAPREPRDRWGAGPQTISAPRRAGCFVFFFDSKRSAFAGSEAKQIGSIYFLRKERCFLVHTAADCEQIFFFWLRTDRIRYWELERSDLLFVFFFETSDRISRNNS
jgi:hypothetical protein